MNKGATSLPRYSRDFFARRSEDTGFVRDTLEKVHRLVDILEYFNRNPLLRESVALKGGTAINLTIFNLPRLSVDIDLDYLKPVGRNAMLAERQHITADILKYMETQNYSLSPKAKRTHSLDSWVFRYINSAGNWDNIKVEINYSMRMHILPTKERGIACEHFSSDYGINSLAAIEIFASKISALMDRAAARDLYDVNNMILFGLFDESEQELLRKSVVFYSALASRTPNIEFGTSRIDELTDHRIRTDLLPVIRRKEYFSLDEAKGRVKDFVSELMILTPHEEEFVTRFWNKEYRPELLFEDATIVERIEQHPMALWKMRDTGGIDLGEPG